MTISLEEDTLFSAFSSSSIHAYRLLLTLVYVHLTSSYLLADIHLFPLKSLQTARPEHSAKGNVVLVAPQ